jgi:uncharacterized sulfatase
MPTYIAFIVIVVVSCFATKVFAETASNKPPNIIVIISDDHMWTDYGFMGHPQVQTPHIDRLAKEGLTFTRGYVPSSLCCPSLASIITGMYPHQHKVTSNDPPEIPGKTKKEWFEAGRDIMNQHMKEVPTLARVLGERGYLSLQTGKWWQGHYRNGGFTHGMTNGGRHGDVGLDIGRKTMQPINDFIGEAKAANKPFLVWYAPLMPHDPHTPPDRLFNKYIDKDPSPHVARYWAMIEWFDETIGDLRTSLDKQGVADNTIIVYVADNGWIQNPETKKYAAKSKLSQYDGGLRTPIIVHWPKKIAPRMASELAQSIDIYPTLMKAVGIPVAANLPGIVLTDEVAVKARTTIYGECFTHSSKDLLVPSKSLCWRWMIDGNTKIIVPDKTNQPNDVVEVYDLTADKFEENNIAAERSDDVKTMLKKLDAWWTP